MATANPQLKCVECKQAYDGLALGSRCPNDGRVLAPAATVDSAPDDPGLGRVLGGKYAIVDILGRGGFGAVYRAIQEPVGRLVAIKLIRPVGGQRSDVQGRFFREARVVAQLNDPTIVTLFDYGEDEDGALYMACELVDGVSLAQAVQAGPMDPRRVAGILAQSLRALAVAHRAGLIHRDVKPGNIMVQSDAFGQEQVKVLDFGIAKVLDVQEEVEGDVQTREGVVLGTPRYMAPEQARNQTIDARTDLYSLGVVAYELLSGKAPYKGDSAVEVLIAHISQPLPPVAPALRVPSALLAVVERALEKDPNDRFQSASEMAEAISAAYPDIPIGSAVYGSTQMPRVDRAVAEAFAPTQLSDGFTGGTSKEMVGEVVAEALADREAGVPTGQVESSGTPKWPFLALAAVVAAVVWFAVSGPTTEPVGLPDAAPSVRAVSPVLKPDAAPVQDAAVDAAVPDAAPDAQLADAAKKPKPTVKKPPVRRRPPVRPKSNPNGLQVPEF